MADTQPAAAPQPTFQIQRLYLKDASLEMPNAPGIFLEHEAPQIDIQLEVGNSAVVEGIYEVIVRTTVTAKIKDKVLFLAECKQAGIFEIRGVPNEQFDAVIGIACPSIVYPYLRASLADLISRTGLPPVHLAEINFEALYRQRLEQQAQAAANAPAPVTPQ
ncbi:MAG: protein-export chaperone SecB [Burkholderiales bacterium]|jgi:preprotein translocase subunit SecB|nr:protein-export chaperone SecB [Burkholderiales bacterium]